MAEMRRIVFDRNCAGSTELTGIALNGERNSLEIKVVEKKKEDMVDELIQSAK